MRALIQNKNSSALDCDVFHLDHEQEVRPHLQPFKRFQSFDFYYFSAKCIQIVFFFFIQTKRSSISLQQQATCRRCWKRAASSCQRLDCLTQWMDTTYWRYDSESVMQLRQEVELHPHQSASLFLTLLHFPNTCRDCWLWSTRCCPVDCWEITGKFQPFWPWWKTLWGSSVLWSDLLGSRGPPVSQVWQHIFYCGVGWRRQQYKSKPSLLLLGLELGVLVHRGVFPHGPVTILSNKAKLDIDMKMAAGSNSSYPGIHLP